MRNKNILFVCQYFYPEKISSGVLPYEMASEMVKKGFHVEALVGYPKEYSNNEKVPLMEEIDGITVTRINYFHSVRKNFVGRIINYLSFCWAVLKNKKHFKNIDKCICYTNPPLLPYIIARLSKKNKFKMYFEIYDLYPDVAIKAKVMNENSLICKIMSYATNYALKKSDKIILLSNEMKDYLINSRSDLNLETKCIVIPNWYKKQDLKLTINSKNNKLKVLYGGNMGVLQDMETLINSMIMLKDNNKIEFILAGHGIKKERIKEIIEKEKLTNCKIIEFLPKNQYDELMQDVDLAVVSLEHFGLGLGSPSKVYGYLALGLPIIAIMPDETDVVKDIRQYKNGIFIRQGDSDKLTNSLINLSKDRNKIYEMKKNSINLFINKYELHIIAEKYEKIFKEN